jgi:hypothetical protein
MKKFICILVLLYLGGGPDQRISIASGADVREKIPGVAYEAYRNRQIPWLIHVIRIDRTKPEFEIATSLGEGTKIGVNRLSEQMDLFPKAIGKPIAAVNGDFFRTEHEGYSGDPRGLQIRDGELVSAPVDRACMWIDKTGTPQMGEVTPKFTVTWPSGDKVSFGLNEERGWGGGAVLYTPAMGYSTMTHGGVEYILERVEKEDWIPLQAGKTYRARVKEVRQGGNSRLKDDQLILSVSRAVSNVAMGSVLTLSTATSPDLAGVRMAIGGGPALVRAGKASPDRVYKGFDRHPRAAIGWNKTEMLFVAVDGRQWDSNGMTLPELADVLVRLKCDEAINLDGGGSAEVWMKGEVMNSPCYGERAMGNAVVLVEKKQTKAP